MLCALIVSICQYWKQSWKPFRIGKRGVSSSFLTAQNNPLGYTLMSVGQSENCSTDAVVNDVTMNTLSLFVFVDP